MNDLLFLSPDISNTTLGVKMAMQTDLNPNSIAFRTITNHLVQGLLQIADVDPHEFACVLLPGDDAMILEATLQTVIPNRDARVLVAVSGQPDTKIVELLETLNIPHDVVVTPRSQTIDQKMIRQHIKQTPTITHFIMSHQDATVGVLHPLAPLMADLHLAGVTTILDARATFGGIPIDCDTLGIDYLITVFHHALHSVPGFGAVIARRTKIAQTADQSHSVSLDLFAQLAFMELSGGAWRHGAPTQSVIAADCAIAMLQAHGGVAKRYQHFRQLQHTLASGMTALGFEPLCPPFWQSPLMTAFAYPNHQFDFDAFAKALQLRGFEIAPGMTQCPSFRVATSGSVDLSELNAFLAAVKQITQERV
jgi:2-aminoethylphosphonate-pyruvate transaminase